MTEEKTQDKSLLIERMFGVGAHFGYSRSRRHPSTTPFIFGAKNRVEILDLEKTSEQLQAAKEFVRELAKSGKMMLFVSGKHEARKALIEGAQNASAPFVAGRWIGGTMTNFSEIKKRIERLEELTEGR